MSIQDYSDFLPEDGEDQPILPQKAKQSQPVENEATQRQKRINIIVATVALFFSNTRFAVVSPSLWTYIKATGGSLFFYGGVVCAFSVGQIIGAPLLGYWSNKRASREPIICSLILITIAGILYSASFDPQLILVSRFLQGIGSGHNAVIQSYVAQSSPSTTSGKSRSLANLNLFGNLGFAAGPGFGALLSFLHIKYGYFEVEPYSSAGYFCTITSVIVLLLMIFLFKDEKYTQPISQNDTAIKSEKLSIQKKILLWIMIFMMFNQFNELAVYDTLATPITKDHYHWKSFENSILWVGIAFATLLSFLSIHAISKLKLMSDAFIVIFNLILQTAGCAIIIQPDGSLPLWRFLLGTAGISWGFPISQIYIISTYSKILGSKKQGFWMGLLTAGGAAARMFGPLWSTAIYHEFHMYLVFVILAGMLLCNILLAVILYTGGLISKNMPKPTTIN